MITKKEVTQLSYEITGLAIKVHKALGPGLLESMYEECLKIELIKNGYDVKQQLYTTIDYEGVTIETKISSRFISQRFNNCRTQSCGGNTRYSRSSTFNIHESSEKTTGIAD